MSISTIAGLQQLLRQRHEIEGQHAVTDAEITNMLDLVVDGLKAGVAQS